MRASTLTRIALAALMLALSLAGCGRSDVQDTPVAPMPPAEDPASDPATVTAPSAHSASFSYLEGVWSVTASLIQIDDPGLAGTATPPSGRWELVVLGDSMTANLPGLRYEGLIETENEGWSYLGFVTGTSETGEMLMGTLEFRGTLTGDDSFSGSAIQSVDASADTPGYSVRWDLTGARQP